MITSKARIVQPKLKRIFYPFIMWKCGDSNPGPTACHAVALPDCATPPYPGVAPSR